eukprot:TRINITY_DN328_c0_g1_i1.p1 TRINITY_DN328_c0_g1~~TRINITY_DN328_c0_g1_i1.p1  ORF type:complete len:439 (-),score=191.01 TRINITY_DN328_c0_g1_i1:119-1435(-)
MSNKGEAKERGWEKVQIKAFTSWLNGFLKERGLEIHDISKDLSDGVLLINFLELLSQKKIGQKYDQKPDSRIKMIQNLHIALQFLEKNLEVRVTCSAEDFVDHNLKMILGLLWSLFKKFRIATIKHQDKSSEEGLLLWVRNTTEGYKDVNIENYKQSFRDGLAFTALCDKFVDNKETFDFDKFTKENGVDNLNAAFDAAEKHLGIPKLLEAQEVFDGNTDERSLVLYISLYFHAFLAKQQQLEMQKDKEKLQREMQGLAGNLEERAKLASELQVENGHLKEEIQLLKSTHQTQLDDERAKFAEMKQSLEEQIAQLTAKLNKETEERAKEKEATTKRNRAEISGLDVLRTHLDNHVEDLNRWMRYLDLDSQSEVDFSGEVRPKIMGDIAKQSFDAQVEYLSQKLAKENDEILSFLKQKETEAKVKKANEKKKKERQSHQ